MMKSQRTTKERSRWLPLGYLWRIEGLRICRQLAIQSLGLGQCIDRIGHRLRQAVIIIICGALLDYQIRSDLLPPVSSSLVIWKLGIEKLLKVPAKDRWQIKQGTENTSEENLMAYTYSIKETKQYTDAAVMRAGPCVNLSFSGLNKTGARLLAKLSAVHFGEESANLQRIRVKVASISLLQSAILRRTSPR